MDYSAVGLCCGACSDGALSSFSSVGRWFEMKSVCFFLAGLFLGGISGVVWMCLCFTASEADRSMADCEQEKG